METRWKVRMDEDPRPLLELRERNMIRLRSDPQSKTSIEDYNEMLRSAYYNQVAEYER